MRGLDLFTEFDVENSIYFDSLRIREQDFSSYARRYVEPALLHNDIYGVTKGGSCTKVKLDGKFFAILTVHQISSPEYIKKFGLLNYQNRTISTASHLYHLGAEEFLDCTVFDFTEAVQNGFLEKSP